MIRWRSRARTALGSGAAVALGAHFQVSVTAAPDAPRTESASADLHALLVRGRAGFELLAAAASTSPPATSSTSNASSSSAARSFAGLVVASPAPPPRAARRRDGRAPPRGRRPPRPHLPAPRRGDGPTVPAVDPRAFVSAALEGAFALGPALTRGDRRLSLILRLRALRA